MSPRSPPGALTPDMPKPSQLTPAMRQYMEAKKELPRDTILLFRMGDFYEIFFDDAKRAAPLMDIVLTQRGGVPMCGVPYHALRSYVSKVLAAGVKVAIAEQMEDPKQAKGLVRRAVTLGLPVILLGQENAESESVQSDYTRLANELIQHTGPMA